MFEAVFASGVAFKEDLENQAMKLVSEIGPHVQDQESLKLICLLQLMIFLLLNISNQTTLMLTYQMTHVQMEPMLELKEMIHLPTNLVLEMA